MEELFCETTFFTNFEGNYHLMKITESFTKKFATITKLILPAILLFSCDPKEPEPTPTPETTLTMRCQMMYNGNPISMNQTLTTAEGYPFQVKELKIILTQIKNGEKILLDASKMDLSNSGNVLFKGVGKPADFLNLQGAIGVVEPWNNADPVSFPTTSPLYIMNMADMHWGWAAGYIFYKFEGVFSTTSGSTNLNEIFTYHIGMNQYRKLFDWENITWEKIAEHQYESVVYFHVDEIFNGVGGVVDLVAEPFTHATPDKAELNEKIATNFKNALRP